MPCPPVAPVSFDTTWDRLYSQGQQLNRYPFDFVVSFVLRNAPHTRSRQEVKLLELGPGAGNNLWFAAREGFQVAGVEASPHALEYLRARFEAEGLTGEFILGDFAAPLPFPTDAFDLVIDRGSLMCTGMSVCRKAIAEVCRVLRPGGRFLFNPRSSRDSCHAAGRSGPDGVTVDIAQGTLSQYAQILFLDRADIASLLPPPWRLLSAEHVETTDEFAPDHPIKAEWRIVAEKTF